MLRRSMLHPRSTLLHRNVWLRRRSAWPRPNARRLRCNMRLRRNMAVGRVRQHRPAVEGDTMNTRTRNDTTGREPAVRAQSLFPRHIGRGYYRSVPKRAVRRYAWSISRQVTSVPLRTTSP
jgi:hypothetical protein